MARAGQPGRRQDPLEARPADLDAFALREQLGEVGVVDVAIRRPPEIDDPGPERRREPPSRRPAPVAVDEPAWPSRHSWRSESPTMAAVSVIVSSCFTTRVRTQARRCSLEVIVIVVSIPGD
jgi:hypothetical protein